MPLAAIRSLLHKMVIIVYLYSSAYETPIINLDTESVLFIGTEFSILYTSSKVICAREREYCLLALNLVSSTPPCIRQPGPRVCYFFDPLLPQSDTSSIHCSPRAWGLRHCVVQAWLCAFC